MSKDETGESPASENTTGMDENGHLVLPAAIPSFSLGALFMPAIWGPAHGQWITILYYPLWVFTDSILMGAYKEGGAFLIGAPLIIIFMAALTIWYASTAQKPAYYRVHDRFTPEAYAKRERIWNICMIAVAVILIALATYYNLFLYDGVQASLATNAAA